MTRIVLLAVLFISFSTSLMSQNNEYKSLWNEVKELRKEGKLASANDKLGELYIIAAKEKNYDQMIKALVSQSKVSQSLEEDFYVNDIKRLLRKVIITFWSQ